MTHSLRLGLFAAILAAGSLSTPRSPAADLDIHLAPGGDDRSSGDATAPFATPQRSLRAAAEIAAKSTDAKVRIQFRAGVYRIAAPLLIDRKHVPAQGSLTLAAAEGERAVISGGKSLTGWKVNGDGTWSTTVPEAREGKWSFRELFADGQRRPRARHPNAGYLRLGEAFPDKRSGFTFAAKDLPSGWAGGGELIFLHDWSISRIPVKEVAHDTGRLTAAYPIGNRADHYKIDHFEKHPRYFVEDHCAFLDAPGEWLLEEGGVLTYRPYPTENPETTEIIAPQATALVGVAGDDEAAVRHVHIKGLHFEHCAWPLPSYGLASSQASAYERREEPGRHLPSAFVPAALHFERAEDCSFTAGRIAHLGTSGIQFGSRTQRCRLEDSVLEDISANGVNLGEDTSRLVGGRPWWQSAPEQAASGHLAQHNRIERCGEQFFGAVAVWGGLVRDMRIEHNEIAHHPYTGVSLGWVWNPTPTPAGGNLVAHNHIHHVMQILSDGGGIYTLGRQPGTRLVGNVIHDVLLNAGRAESNGMFLDEGSDQIDIADNVIYNIARSPLRFHRAQQMTVRNNTLVVPSPDSPPLTYNSTDPQNIRKVENPVLLRKDFDPASVSRAAAGPRRHN